MPELEHELTESTKYYPKPNAPEITLHEHIVICSCRWYFAMTVATHPMTDIHLVECYRAKNLVHMKGVDHLSRMAKDGERGACPMSFVDDLKKHEGHEVSFKHIEDNVQKVQTRDVRAVNSGWVMMEDSIHPDIYIGNIIDYICLHCAKLCPDCGKKDR